MRTRIVVPMFGLLLCWLLVTAALPKTADPNDLIAHEWGTFTSVAGEDGLPVRWQISGHSEDLPCFVNRFGELKSVFAAMVRMETPVIYFYGSSEVSADVRVRFPNGTITEWYPNATVAGVKATEWHAVRVQPKAKPEFPAGRESHYYTARETDAAPLQVGSQKEKFLFYRGVGDFPLPLSANIASDGRIEVKSRNEGAVPGVIVFENRGGNRRYRVLGALERETTVDLNSLQADGDGILRDLKRILVENGLYEREAQAMVDTWRDSWFEEGVRLFYIVPRHDVDSILPLEIRPEPLKTERVFVGRMELITQAIKDEVKQAVAARDRATLNKYGRFVKVIADRAGLVNHPFINTIYAEFLAKASTCSR